MSWFGAVLMMVMLLAGSLAYATSLAWAAGEIRHRVAVLVLSGCALVIVMAVILARHG